MSSMNLGRVQGASIWQVSNYSVSDTNVIVATIVPESGVNIKPLKGDLAVIVSAPSSGSQDYIGWLCKITLVASGTLATLEPIFKLKGDQGQQGIQGEQGIQGIQGQKGDTGDPFAISKIYSSVSAMNSGYATDGVKIGGFVLINTGNVEDEDNAKLYVKGNSAYEYLTDMSGASGLQGPRGEQGPQGIQGPQGLQGPAGADGKTPSLSINDSGELVATFE